MSNYSTRSAAVAKYSREVQETMYVLRLKIQLGFHFFKERSDRGKLFNYKRVGKLSPAIRLATDLKLVH